MIEFKVYQRQERTELGTLAEVAGKGGKVRPTPGTLADSSKQLTLIVTKKDGTSGLVHCSRSVGNMLRSQEITLATTLGFPIIEWEPKDDNGQPRGFIQNLLVQPTREGATTPEISVDDVKEIPKFEPEPVNWDNLIALGI